MDQVFLVVKMGLEWDARSAKHSATVYASAACPQLPALPFDAIPSVSIMTAGRGVRLKALGTDRIHRTLAIHHSRGKHAIGRRGRRRCVLLTYCRWAGLLCR
jgi:hypothetical protein